jgi:hypothetical protein
MATSKSLPQRAWLRLSGALLISLWCLQAFAQRQSNFRTGDVTRPPTEEIPAGIILPARLNHGFSAAKAHPGVTISARIMQDVPLLGGKIPEGAKVIGSIVSSNANSNSSVANVSFRFDQVEIHNRRFAVVTDLRAVAGFMEVESAEIPEFSTGFGTPYIWANTQLVGGGERYGYGGPVTDSNSNTVGTAVYHGILAHVSAQPGTKCRGPLDDDNSLQALWVFSADACGVYGLNGVTIAHAGRTEPAGTIILQAPAENITLREGTGMLLRVIR